jgi:hypothetical protein
MDLDRLFSIAGALAMAGWLALVLSVLFDWRRLRQLVPGLLIPLGLSVAYVALIVTGFPGAEGGFGSLDQVAALFRSREMLLAGWIHYLAFDLLVGVLLARENEQVGIPRVLMIPVFAATFLFGPAGFLAFQALRGIVGRRPLGASA